MVLQEKKTMVLWTKLWYYGQIYGTIPRTIEKKVVHDQKLGNFEL